MAKDQGLKTTKIEILPREEGEEPGMPSFLYEGTWDGEAFAYEVSLEIDGRDVEIEHKSGADPNDDIDGPRWNAWLDATVEIYEAIHATDAWRAAVAEYEAQ